MIVFSVMNLGLYVNFKAKQITSHFYWLWASDLSRFCNIAEVKIVSYCQITNFGQVTIVISTNFLYIFENGKRRFVC